MLCVLVDFVLDTRPNPSGAGISDSRRLRSQRDGEPHCVIGASDIKNLGHPSFERSFFELTGV